MFPIGAVETPVTVRDRWLMAWKDANVMTERGPVYHSRFEVEENVSLLTANEDRTSAAISNHGLNFLKD
jgi:hypothetical protein